MLLKPYKILFVACASLIVGCAGGPNVTVCISYPKKNEFVCIDHNQKTILVPYADSDKYVAFPPDDAKTLIEVCKLNNTNPQTQAVIQSYEQKFREALK